MTSEETSSSGASLIAANSHFAGAMTAGDVAGAEGDLGRRHGAADVDGERASAGEWAADAMFVRNRRRAGNGLQPRAARRAWSRAGFEQRQRVGVSGLAQHRLDRPALHDHARIHDDDAVAMSGDHREIVADEQDRHLRFRPQSVDEGENARLHRDVERRGRLVGDDEARRTADRHGDHRPLPFAAGQRERIGSRRAFRLGQSHMIEQLDCARLRLALAQAPMQHQRFGDLRANAAQRIESRHRLLEDHGDAIAAQLTQVHLRRGRPALAPRSGSNPKRARLLASSPSARAPSSSCRSRTRRPPRGSRPHQAKTTSDRRRAAIPGVSRHRQRARRPRAAFSSGPSVSDRARRATRRRAD